MEDRSYVINSRQAWKIWLFALIGMLSLLSFASLLLPRVQFSNECFRGPVDRGCGALFPGSVLVLDGYSM
jgi:hypothetical protein